MKQLLIIFLLSFPFHFNSDFTSDYLRVYEGEWNGTLTYLNYGDDKTLVDLPVRMEAVFKNGKLDFDFYYNEGDGRTEKRTGNFRIKGGKIHYNGKWELQSSELSDLENWSLILVSTGQDNNRPASFRKTVNVSPERIQVEKWVQYEGEEEYFMRNRHVYEK